MDSEETRFVAHFSGYSGDKHLYWKIGWNNQVTLLALGYEDLNEGEGAVAFWASPVVGQKKVWMVIPELPHNEQLARGLYRLGIEEEGELDELKSPLSAHERLELRLSLPREFWPKKWLEEERQN